jgi:hypothetical protein
MPKKYRVEMTLVEDASGTQLDTDTHTEDYDSETDARDGFQDKVKAAREKGKGHGRP